MTKTSEQIEFAEIVERLKEAGLNQAEVARQLHITRSAIGMILKGQRSPHPSRLIALRELEGRMLKAREHGETIETREASLSKLYNALELMERQDRPKFEVAKSVIESLAEKPKPATLTEEQRKILKAAENSSPPVMRGGGRKVRPILPPGEPAKTNSAKEGEGTSGNPVERASQHLIDASKPRHHK